MFCCAFHSGGTQFSRTYNCQKVEYGDTENSSQSGSGHVVNVLHTIAN